MAGSYRSRKDYSHYPIRKLSSLYNSPCQNILSLQGIMLLDQSDNRAAIGELPRRALENDEECRRERVLLVQAANQEANRAKASENRKDLSAQERHNLSHSSHDLPGICRYSQRQRVVHADDKVSDTAAEFSSCLRPATSSCVFRGI